MAVLAPPDWYPPRDTAMEAPSPPTNNQTGPRQRASPSADTSSPAHSPTSHPQQQPYPYPIQQQQAQGAWTPSIAAQPFYPSFYQNHPHPQHHPQQAYGHLPHPHPSPQPPYFDPANAQLAQAQVQWAYQQMMFNAQQGFPHIPPQHQQVRPPGGATPDYFANAAAFNQFPSGTPIPHPSGGGPAYRGPGNDPQNQQGQFGAFHPYRRPSRQQSSHAPDPNVTDWRANTIPVGPPQPPYGQRDAAGSSSSVNSANTASRPRTNSNQSAHSSRSSNHTIPSGSNTPNGSARSRNGVPQERSGSSSSVPRTSSSSVAPVPTQRVPHHRNSSSSSSGSSASARPSANSSAATTSSSTTSVAPTNGSHTLRPARPSPLSQGNFTAAEKRMSRDDSELGLTTSSTMRTERDPTPGASTLRSGGLKGRLRRALSFNAEKALKEEEGEDDPIKPRESTSRIDTKVEPRPSIGGASPLSPDSTTETVTDADQASTATVQTKKRGRAASLFNSRLNASTDNISLSSTVSSASVMIRKLGSMGKLARRNSLAGITSLFKDKKDKADTDGEGSGKKGKKDKPKDKGKSSKSEASEASVSHATAELDRTTSGEWTAGPEMSGLSPAAKLARQHTLKSNAENAARAKAAHEARTKVENEERSANGTAAGINSGTGIAGGVPTWEKNTATRQGSPVKRGGGAVRVSEDGTRVVVEDDDSASDGTSTEGHGTPYSQGAMGAHEAGWDDDDDWGEGEGEEDVTIRVGLERISVEDEPEPWGVDVRRSVERARKPARGILKHAASYDQQNRTDQPPAIRARSNSYDSHGQNELGPLARIPSPDPDHIDGLHRHPSHSSTHSQTPAGPTPSLPPLAFETSSIRLGSPSATQTEHNPLGPHPPEKASPLFSHANSSAPALSTMLSTSTTPTLTHRSATVPSKRLTFASNLSVYDTFSASVYDRRSEPATWSRLTPALAQRIKEELNSYKMEEMEVHAASRIHTQFFV